VGFLVPFLRSIFDPFLANSQSRISLFYGTFSMSMVVFGPFSDVFWTVLLVTILSTFHQSGVRVLTLGLLKALRVLVFILGVMVGAVRRPITRPCVGLRRSLCLISGRSSADFTLVRVAA
jgi:hypothetical protein